MNRPGCPHWNLRISRSEAGPQERNRATLPVHHARGEAPVVTQPEDEIAAGSGDRSHWRVSHADREQVIETLKAAFVQGRLAKDELRSGWARYSSRGLAQN